MPVKEEENYLKKADEAELQKRADRADQSVLIFGKSKTVLLCPWLIALTP